MSAPSKEKKAITAVKIERELEDNDEITTQQTYTPRPFMDFYNWSTMSKQVASEVWAEKTAMELIEWAETRNGTSSLTLNEFYVFKGLDRETFQDLTEKFPVLKKARAYARGILGNKRENGLIHKRLDPTSVAFMMPHYDPDWKAIVEWRASLKQPEGTSGQPIKEYILMKEIPNSDLVPKREETNGKSSQTDKDNQTKDGL